MPTDENKEISPIGLCNFRNQKKKFGIKIDDRRRHVYVVGKTGVGKTTLLENMVVADLLAGRGIGVVDPHGEFAERMLDFVPEERVEDVIYFNPADTDYPIAFNPMESVSAEHRHLVASGLMGVFKKIWPDVWSARMEYILNNTLLALLEFPSSTVLGIMRMLSEPNYRKKIVENLQDPVVKAFWVNEFARYTQRLETEAVAAIQNKVGQFVSNPLVRNIMGQAHSTLNMRKVMDESKIFIANLSKGRIGEDNSALLGSMLVTRLQLAAMSRVDLPEKDRKDFFLYVDEFQNFATDSFANILSEARKYRLVLILSHQYIGQLVRDNNTKVRDAVFGNVGTIICFRIGAADAEFMEKEFMPEFMEQDLVNLSKANIYTKLMIDGVTSRPFSAETMPPPKQPLVFYRDEIIKFSREKYGTPRATVEKRIASELQEGSEKAVEEKVVRRGERSIGDAFREGGARPFKKSGQYPPQYHAMRGGHEPYGSVPPRAGQASYGERSFSGQGQYPPYASGHIEQRNVRPRPEQTPYKQQNPVSYSEGKEIPPQFFRQTQPKNNAPNSFFQNAERSESKQPVVSARRSVDEGGSKTKPQFIKKDINIADLRKAISASLGRSNEANDSEPVLHNEAIPQHIEPPVVSSSTSLETNRVEPPPIRHGVIDVEDDHNDDDDKSDIRNDDHDNDHNNNTAPISPELVEGDNASNDGTTEKSRAKTPVVPPRRSLSEGGSHVEPLYGTEEDAKDVAEAISLEEMAEKEEKGTDEIEE